MDVEVYTFAIPWGSWVEEGDCEVVEGKGSADMEKMKKIGEAAVEVVGGGCEAVGLAIVSILELMESVKVERWGWDSETEDHWRLEGAEG